MSASAATAPAADDVKVADINKSNEKPPTADVIKKIEDYTVLDKQGQKLSFKSIYDGPDSTGRVLVIFIRHFFCGVSFHIRPHIDLSRFQSVTLDANTF
jgi:hypothetical protein